MPAAISELTVEAGADWNLTFTYDTPLADGVTPDPTKPINVTGYTAQLEIRYNSQDGTTAALFTASTVTIGSVAPEITIPVGTDGRFVMAVPAVRTATLPQVTWAKAFGGSDPATHYTLHVLDPAGHETYTNTGLLIIKPA